LECRRRAGWRTARPTGARRRPPSRSSPPRSKRADAGDGSRSNRRTGNPAWCKGPSRPRPCSGLVRRHPSGPAATGRVVGRTHDRTRSEHQITQKPLRSRGRSLIAPPLSRVSCFFLLPFRDHGSLRGRRMPPQHLVRSTGAAMSTTSSHGTHAAQRPPSQPACTLAPEGNPHIRADARRDLFTVWSGARRLF
jgi:hypothetical protein